MSGRESDMSGLSLGCKFIYQLMRLKVNGMRWSVCVCAINHCLLV